LDVTVLPAVVALKLVLSLLKQAAAHKVCICVHGGFQIQGHDYERSYAHTVLASTLKIMIVIGTFLKFN
jgi:cell division FtsZ-interacting protein ZapD